MSASGRIVPILPRRPTSPALQHFILGKHDTTKLNIVTKMYLTSQREVRCCQDKKRGKREL